MRHMLKIKQFECNCKHKQEANIRQHNATLGRWHNEQETKKWKNEYVWQHENQNENQKTIEQNEHVWQNIDMKMQMKNNETGIQMKKKIKRTQKNLQKRPLPLTLRSFPAYWKMAMSYLTSRGLREHMVSLLLKLANNRTMKKLKTKIHMKKKTKKRKTEI